MEGSALNRVVFVLAPQFPWPFTDGGRIGIGYRIRELGRRGFEVQLFCTVKPGEWDGRPTPLHDWCASVTVVPRTSGRRSALVWLSTRPFQITSRDVAAFRAALQARAAERPPAIVQAEHSSMAAFRDTPLAGDPAWVVTFHNLEWRGAWQRALSDWRRPHLAFHYVIEGFRLRAHEHRLLRDGRFDAYCFVSAQELEECRAIAGPSRAVFRTLPTGTDLPPAIERQPGSRELLFLGSLWYDPNIAALDWFLSEVWPLVLARVPDATLSVVGRSPTARVHRLVADAPRVTLTADVPEIESWMQKAAGVIIPVRHGAGIKVKAIEAMGRGAVCVCTSHALEGLELPAEPVALVADDPADFSAHCERVLAGDPALGAIAAQARAWIAAHYSWSVVGDRIAALYRELSDSPVPAEAAG